MWIPVVILTVDGVGACSRDRNGLWRCDETVDGLDPGREGSSTRRSALDPASIGFGVELLNRVCTPDKKGRSTGGEKSCSTPQVRRSKEALLAGSTDIRSWEAVGGRDLQRRKDAGVMMLLAGTRDCERMEVSGG